MLELALWGFCEALPFVFMECIFWPHPKEGTMREVGHLFRCVFVYTSAQAHVYVYVCAG